MPNSAQIRIKWLEGSFNKGRGRISRSKGSFRRNEYIFRGLAESHYLPQKIFVTIDLNFVVPTNRPQIKVYVISCTFTRFEHKEHQS